LSQESGAFRWRFGIDDKPNVVVLEMRSLCWRLMAETGKELGLLVIDYLQLMESNGSDNLCKSCRGSRAA
jgi:replicative DNA helicase